MYAKGIATKNRILKVGKRLFLKKGYRDTTYRDICDAAQVNPGTLSHHFNGKAGLADAIYRATIADLMGIVSERFPEEEAIIQVLVATIKYFCLLFDDETFLHFFAEYTVDSLDGTGIGALDNGVTQQVFESSLGKDDARIVMPLNLGMDRAFEGLILEQGQSIDRDSAIRLFFSMAYAPIPDAQEAIDHAWSLSKSLEVGFHDFKLLVS